MKDVSILQIEIILNFDNWFSISVDETTKNQQIQDLVQRMESRPNSGNWLKKNINELSIFKLKLKASSEKIIGHKTL